MWLTIGVILAAAALLAVISAESARRRQIAGRRDAGAGLYVEYAGGKARQPA